MKPSSLVLFLALVLASFARAELTDEQRRQPLEVDAPDPKLAKIVLLAGPVSHAGGEHEYFAGCALLAEWLKQTAGVWPVLVGDGWPKNETVLDRARTIVVYADAGPKLPLLDPARWARMKSLMQGGAGLVMLHQSMDIPADHAEELQGWLGGVFLADIGNRGHWDMDFPQLARHPVTRGVEPLKILGDGFLYNLHFAPGAVSLMAGAVPDKSRTTADAKAHTGRAETIAWAYQRPGGGRGFGFTGAHLHRNWSLEGQRRLVLNGILWSAGLEVPEGGAPVAMREGSLGENLDLKPVKAAGGGKPVGQ